MALCLRVALGRLCSVLSLGLASPTSRTQSPTITFLDGQLADGRSLDMCVCAILCTHVCMCAPVCMYTREGAYTHM